MTSKKKILVAPLNWGLGHATRCIPIIKSLIHYQFEPIIASDGEALALLQKEFPILKTYTLPASSISYSKSGNIKWKLIQQLPKFLKTAVHEHKVIAKIHEKEHLAGIISDNRFGAYLKDIPSVYITHQLNVLSGNTTFLSSRLHQYIITKFDECWVPDKKGKGSLSGKLSYVVMKVPTKYMGVLSRLKKLELPKKYDVLVVLSGPEPQRTLLENRLCLAFAKTTKKILLVRGLINNPAPLLISNEHIRIKNYLLSEELERAINESGVVIARSGFSTIMDLASLGKKAFFIPTPGQYEQLYLAKRMQTMGKAPYASQEDFNETLLDKLEDYKGFSELLETKEHLPQKLFNLF